MKKLLFSATLLLLCFTAQADNTSANPYTSEAQALTRAVPVAADFVASKALNLNLVNGFSIMLCAASGQTLSGAGTLQAYRFDDRRGLVARNPGKDLAVSVTATSCQGAACRCQAWDDIQMADSSEVWVMFATNGVTVSSGTVTVYYSGYRKLR